MPTGYDLVCLSHLRWNFVYQRPQHLLTRFAREHRVFYIEEPVVDAGPTRVETARVESGVRVVVPHLTKGCIGEKSAPALRELLDDFFEQEEIVDYVLWYYTPMAMAFSSHLHPRAVVYDCMDELSAFRFAPPLLRKHEAELLARADLVFTGGHSLYEAKRGQHPRVYPLPSSVDREHFARARSHVGEPEDQAGIRHPRLGFFGVIDERMDLELIRTIAEQRQDWQIVLVGPIAKLIPDELPQGQNIHVLGAKNYQELPTYIAGWDVALLPFALNESTRYISPTKTPEYLAAGKPVVSTPIRDVVRPYGDLRLVRVAATAKEFIQACEQALLDDMALRLPEIDAWLATMSWDKTWSRMSELINGIVRTSSVSRLTAEPFPPSYAGDMEIAPVGQQRASSV